MSYNLSVWLDDRTAEALARLCYAEDRKRGNMVRVLINTAAVERDLIKKNKVHENLEQQCGKKPLQTT